MNISVGYGLEPILTDALSGRIIRDVVTPKFKAGDMPGGIQDGVNAIAEQIQLPPEEAAARAAAADKAERDRAGDGDFGGLFFIGFIFFIFFILPAVEPGARQEARRKDRPWDAPDHHLGRRRLGRGSGGGSSWGGGGELGRRRRRRFWRLLGRRRFFRGRRRLRRLVGDAKMPKKISHVSEADHDIVTVGGRGGRGAYERRDRHRRRGQIERL
jgi:hypothetical protein